MTKPQELGDRWGTISTPRSAERQVGGTDDEWVVIEDVHRAVGLAEQLLDDPEPGSPLFGRTCFVTRYQRSLRPWVNGPAGQRLGLTPIPEGVVNLRMLRRSLAIEMAYRPGGILATKIAMKHVTVATTEGYAARPGGAQAKLLAEVNRHEQERNLGILLEEFRNYEQGIMPSGPGARQLTELFATIDDKLTRTPSSPAKIMGSDQEARSLLTRRAQALHLGVANYCWLSKVLDNQHYGDERFMRQSLSGAGAWQSRTTDPIRTNMRCPTRGDLARVE